MNRILKYLLFILISLFLAAIAYIFTIYLVLFFEVKDICNKAQAEFKSDCVNSLILVLEKKDASVKEKNDAIWVLGQIADKRALPALEKIYTGQIPEREPLDKVISQYEIDKAINWVINGNLTSWMYFMFR